MASIHNSTQVRQTIALERNTRLVNILTQAGINNIKPNLSVVDTILGLKARSAADMGRVVLNNMGTGFNIINTSLAVMIDIRNQLEKIRQEIPTLANADEANLIIAEDDYTSQVGKIFETLASTNFLGKNLFDGTFAKAPATRIPEQNLPLNTSPFKVQTSIDMVSSIDITIPRLLPGDGTIANVTTDNVFNPLFPVTNNTIVALARLNAVGNTAIVGAGAFADQRTLIVNAIPLGINAEQDMINTIVLNAYDNTVITMTSSVPPRPDSRDNAISALGVAKALGEVVTLSANNLNDINIAQNNIINAIDAADAALTAASRSADAINAINAIVHDNTVSYAQQTLWALALAAATINPDPADDEQNARDRLANAKLIVNNYANDRKIRPFPNPTYIGSIKTSSGRVGVMQMISSATNVLDKVIASMTGKKNSLQAARSNLEAQIVELDSAANNYLLADYKQIISQIAESARSLKVISLVDVMYEKTLNGQVNSLEATAASVAA